MHFMASITLGNKVFMVSYDLCSKKLGGKTILFVFILIQAIYIADKIFSIFWDLLVTIPFSFTSGKHVRVMNTPLNPTSI